VAPPVQITGSPWQSAWGTATTPKLAPTASTFAVGVGDKIVVEAVNESNSATFGASPTNAAGTSPATITWASVDAAGTTGSFCRAGSWVGTVTVAGNVQVSLTSAVSALFYGIIVWAFTAAGTSGQGTHASGTGTGSGPSSLPAAAWSANSFVCGLIGDFSAGPIGTLGTTRVYRANIGAATEDTATNTDGNYTVYAWHHADSGAGGSVAVGMTLPTQTWTLVAVEILGTASSATRPRQSRRVQARRTGNVMGRFAR
jgi:hypothetical protein